jgi:peptidoglycan LD-endopeptidase CwlK
MYRLGRRSRSRLSGVHPDLVVVVSTAITLSHIDFTVLEGRRSLERQKTLVASGASQTMNSRHLTGHAIDLGALVDGKVRWDWPLYYQIADAMKKAANYCQIDIEWGGDWTSFKDGPHFQLPRSTYL